MDVLLIGCGNEYRSDDGAGLLVARLAKEMGSEHVAVRESLGEGAALLDAWKGAETVILIDAVCSGSEAGTIYRVEAHRERLPAELFHCSTHAFGVAEAIELARALNRLPARLIVYGIEGKSFAAGIGLSPEVSEAARRVADSVLNDLSRR
ncbi:MAG TPA: hydrogenase maturation protease [Blastocatellia bacterium]|nr:hydrogenase maturation protease [Blastocatellia bacterium]